ncbi:S-adenosyl-L-methionine-dependent methyltransferase [Dendrothele bispora CBS 962.96]|uniref:S-adenosyl-L-methionine-dependent methyltransferase n=1 Tax=Dendrothele bispora (strain CBS 962.96) TaxID=1314807 RepID=A0A4S8MTN9_DENBC|nr:S-adenosyl-L-methionine-dependent methyltransferase [Dendrothele bispora CBS 962.96]
MHTDTDDEDAYSDASFGFDNASGIASSHTSHDVSMRSASPVPSVRSISSSFRAQAYTHEYGRGLNNYSEVYRLPADDEELFRLDTQHVMFTKLMGKYHPKMAEVMVDDVPGEPKAVLDLGCGSGMWIMDVAKDFPNCSAVAVDLVPMQSLDMPSNLRSEVDDINLGLEHFYGDFNVVHARLISTGIKDYEGLINHIAFVLRPGGLIDLMEYDFHVYDENHRRVQVDTSAVEGPWWARWMAFANVAARQRGGDVDAATHICSWVRNHPMFEDVQYREFWIPCSPWKKDFPLDISMCMRDDILAFLKSGRPLLLGSGVPEETVRQLEVNAEREQLRASQRHYVRLQCVWAQKKHDS